MFEHFSDEDWERIVPKFHYGTDYPTRIKELTSDQPQMRTRALAYLRTPPIPRIIPLLAQIIRSDAPADRDDLLQLLIEYAEDSHPIYGIYASPGIDPADLLEWRREQWERQNKLYTALVYETESYCRVLNHAQDSVRVKALTLLLHCLAGDSTVIEVLCEVLRHETSEAAFSDMVSALVEAVTEHEVEMPACVYQSCMENPIAQIKKVSLQKNLRLLSGRVVAV